ncbi:MAG: penicillin-binding protein 2 [Proteobacteria bacterium]|nr:penicillin-binding protein 2 [Pseudomonadota bacterium]
MLDKQISQTFDRRSALFITGGVILTSVIILRLLQMQAFQYNKYKRLSENNATRIRVNLPERGRILSATGSSLALDDHVYRIYVIPAEADNMTALLTACQTELSLGPRDMARIAKKISRLRDFQPVVLKESANWDELAGLRAQNLNGLHIEPGFVRRYPGKTMAAHVLGYVGGAEFLTPNARMLDTSPFMMAGQAGLEKQYNDVLSGKPGHSLIQVDAIGKIIGIDAARDTPAVPGKNIKTTLVESVQQKLEDGLKPIDAGCGVAIDIETGNILAMASAPSFDPDSFRGPDGTDIMDQLINDPLKPFMNKAIEGLYPPGSTFKIVVALAALESGAVLPSEKIHCTGEWEYGKHLYHCWEKHGHGWVNIEDAIAHSCDIYFYQIALRVGIDAIKAMATKLGLAQKLLNDLPRELTGILPDRAWKEKTIGQRWQNGDTVISGIGQGFILVNCLQLCVMVARAVSNTAVTPRIVTDDSKNEKRKTKDEFEPMGLVNDNIRIVMNGLERVVQPGGTAAGAAINVGGAKMGGKTGTSQVRRISEEERRTGVRTTEQLTRELRNHGLFVGYAPTINPKYAVAVIAEHAGGSGPAARIAADVMKEMLKKS